MVGKLSRIDGSNIADHARLNAEDECYFWREYTSGRNYTVGPGNDLISNLKKKPSSSSSGELYHKNRVIGECSAFFRSAIRSAWLDDAMLVPIPGSKAKDHPDFDDRMVRIIDGIRPGLDLREIVLQVESREAFHTGERVSVEELQANYTIDQALLDPEPKVIGIFDDVLTAGTHYRAVHDLLADKFPRTKIVGFFVARRVLPPAADDFDF